MTRTLEAIYEQGVLRPLEDPRLAEHQRVVLELHVPPAEEDDQRLAAWNQVYEGLSDDQIADLEAIALDRTHFTTRDC